MGVRMGMWFIGRLIRAVDVTVVRVVAVAMIMCERRVGVGVHVAFTDMEPDPECHEPAGREQRGADPLVP